jgi:hypothetical protein
MSSTYCLKLKKFGQVFSSRSEGREAALNFFSYILDDKKCSSLELDFEDVLIMTPSWLSEFLQTLRKNGIENFIYVNTENITVKNSLEIIKMAEPS